MRDAEENNALDAIKQVRMDIKSFMGNIYCLYKLVKWDGFAVRSPDLTVVNTIPPKLWHIKIIGLVLSSGRCRWLSK